MDIIQRLLGWTAMTITDIPVLVYRS